MSEFGRKNKAFRSCEFIAKFHTTTSHPRINSLQQTSNINRCHNHTIPGNLSLHSSFP